MINKYKYGLKVFLNGKMVHCCLFKENPETKDIENLRKELNEDEEFGLIGIGELLDIRRMTNKEVLSVLRDLQHLKRIIKWQKEIKKK